MRNVLVYLRENLKRSDLLRKQFNCNLPFYYSKLT